MDVLDLLDFGNIDLNEPDNLFDDEYEEVLLVMRAPKRYIRDGNNPFEFYNEVEFKRRFRFSKDCVMHILLTKVEEGVGKINNRGLPIPPVIQLLLCLRYYATASFQLVVGDIMNVSQSTISRTVFRVSVLLASHIRQLIKFPTSVAQINENRLRFRDLGRGNGAIGLPGIDGAIDCTHVRLVDSRLQHIQEVFRNRKGYFSLNVQAIVGPRMEFLDIVPEWPGSQHDSRIFQNSRVHMRFMERELNGSLVGDAGYPCLPFLLTPIQNPATDEQAMYNNIHVRTRRIVEQTFGVWKRRFPCLSKGLTTKLICSTTIIVACAVLHNVSLIYDDVLPEDDEVNNEEYEDGVAGGNDHPQWQPADGFLVRDALIARLFA